MLIVVGFTGSRDGMTEVQSNQLGSMFLFDLPKKIHRSDERTIELHHGSCDGSDIQAAKLMRHVHPGSRIISHPGPENDPWRRDSGVDDEVRPGKNHFARNRDIVDISTVMFATPNTMTHQSRGGTWYTIDYALKVGRPIYVILPDGSFWSAD